MKSVGVGIYGQVWRTEACLHVEVFSVYITPTCGDAVTIADAEDDCELPDTLLLLLLLWLYIDEDCDEDEAALEEVSFTLPLCVLLLALLFIGLSLWPWMRWI